MVTDSKVSASVPVTVMVDPATETVLMPPPAIVKAPVRLFTEVTTFDEAKQVGHEIVPVVLSRAIGEVAATATVPL